jgi:hypothetical protein
MTKTKLTKADKSILYDYFYIENAKLTNKYNTWVDSERESAALMCIYRYYGGTHTEKFRNKYRAFVNWYSDELAKKRENVIKR